MDVYAKTTFVFLCLVATIHQGCSDDCKDVGQYCLDIIQAFMDRMNDKSTFDIDADCRSVRQQLKCFGSCQKEIEEIPRTGTGLKLIDFFCDESQKQKVEAMVRAECEGKKTYRETYEQTLDSCLTTAMNTPPITCSSMNGLISCVYGGLEAGCGREVIPGAQEYVRIMVTDIMTLMVPRCVPELVFSP